MDRSGLTAGERRRLQALLQHTPDARLYRRALAVLAHSRGHTVAEIAAWLQVSRQSVYNWVDAVQRTQDVAVLADAPRTGRPPRGGEDAQALLQVLLAHPPERFGYFATDWTVPLLREQLGHSLGEPYSAPTVRRALHRLGYVWKRTRYVLAPDPEREKKTADSAHRQPLARPQRAARRG